MYSMAIFAVLFVLCILCMEVCEGLCFACVMKCVTHMLTTLQLGGRPPLPIPHSVVWQQYSESAKVDEVKS